MRNIKKTIQEVFGCSKDEAEKMLNEFIKKIEAEFRPYRTFPSGTVRDDSTTISVINITERLLRGEEVKPYFHRESTDYRITMYILQDTNLVTPYIKSLQDIEARVMLKVNEGFYKNEKKIYDVNPSTLRFGYVRIKNPNYR